MARGTSRFVVTAAVGVFVLSGCIRFAPPESIAVSGAAALADVTGDGTADVLANTTAGLARYEYCGAACLQAKEVVAGERVDRVADFNGDGRADVLSLAVSAHKILFGSATGLSASNAVAIPANSETPGFAGVGDFNGDAKLDIVRSGLLFNGSLGRYVVHLGNGAGGFTPSSLSLVTPEGEAGPTQVDVGDVTGDGRDDLVSTFLSELHVTRFGDPMCQSPGGSYTCPYFTTPQFSANKFVLGDINGDGRDDVARYRFDTHSIDFFRSTGNGITPFPPYQTISVPDSRFVIQMGLRDIDADGITDLLLNDWVNTRTWWSGTNDGGFPYEARSDVPLPASGCDQCFGQVNGDDRIDVLVGGKLWLNTSD